MRSTQDIDSLSTLEIDPLLSPALVLPTIFIPLLRKGGERDTANFTHAVALVTEKSHEWELAECPMIRFQWLPPTLKL